MSPCLQVLCVWPVGRVFQQKTINRMNGKTGITKCTFLRIQDFQASVYRQRPVLGQH